MTALDKYQRLEAAALWRESPEAQRRDVIVSIGDATLTMTDMQDRPVTHWSIAALSRANPGELPAIYYPDGDPGETLELEADQAEMIAALEKLRGAVARRRPRKGRLRLTIVAAVIAAIVAGGALWLPDRLEDHALSVLPQVKRDEIGRKLLTDVQALTGPACRDMVGTSALSRLAARVTPEGETPPRLFVVRDGVKNATHLPGGIILINRSLIEDEEDPEVPAGFVVAERLRAKAEDPIARLLDEAGPIAVLQLLTTGELPNETLVRHARTLVTDPAKQLPTETMLAGFAAAGIQPAPYARALVTQGLDDNGLLVANQGDGSEGPVMRDADWLRLQGICSNG